MSDFEFYKDKLYIVKHIVTINGYKKTNTDFYKLFSSKYGEPFSDENGVVKWIVNNNTIDEVVVYIKYSNSHDVIKEIGYYHGYLSQEKFDEYDYELLRRPDNVQSNLD